MTHHRFTLPRSLVAIAGLLLAATAAQAATTIKATVNGMVCAFCAQGIEKRLSQLPGAAAVHVDLKARLVAVEARPGQSLDPARIRAEILDAGYEVATLETLDKPLAEVKAGAAKP